MSHKLLATLLLIASVSTASAAVREPIDVTDGNSDAAALAAARGPEIGYYDMVPDFTTNLASSGAGKLHYLRVHVNLMVKDSADLALLTEHDPLIRDAIVTIIGSKEYNSIATAAGREALRAECRARVAELLQDKKNAPVLQDLLFTSYVYQ